jgi:hypothetical protein
MSNDILQALREKNCQSSLLYQAKLSFIIQGETQTSMKNEK